MKTKIFIVSILFLTLLSNSSVNAGTGIYKSSFTPARSSVQYQPGIQGFSYPSFNNFAGNPNIINSAREVPTFNGITGEGDERKFAIAKLCKNGICKRSGSTGDNDCQAGGTINPLCNYYDTVSFPNSELAENDILRFEIYYHNNGNDPNAGVANETSPDATNVQIGVDLSNYSANTGEPALMVRPKAFIKADNNEYKVNGLALRDGNNQIIRTTTDDIQAFLKEQGLQLEPVAGSAWLYTKTSNSPVNYFNSAITGNTEITYPAQNNFSQVKVNVTPNYTNNKMWLTFNRLPGCFRYSGFIYFDVKVVKPPQTNICTQLNANVSQTPIDINGKAAYPLTVNAITFAPLNQIPTGAQIEWTSTDVNGEFWVDTTAFGAGPGDTAIATKLLIGTGTAITNINQRAVYYIGTGAVNINLTGIPDNQRNAAVCRAGVVIPQPVCKDLLVDHPQQIFVNTISIFKAQARDTNNRTFQGKIRYSVDAGYGLFYTTKPNGTDNTSPTVFELLQNATTLTNNVRTLISSFLLGSLNPGSVSIEVDPGTIVYFIGSQPGLQKIHAQPINTSVLSCQRTFDVMSAPAISQVCEAVQVNRPGTISTGKLSTFNAKAINTQNNNFNGKITYSVTPGYGQFYLNPPNTELNTSNYITEFNSTVLIPSPQGGFCENTSISPATNNSPGNSNTTSATAQPSLLDRLIATQTTTTNNSITVNPGTEVYFIGTQAGQGVIQVSTNCTTVNGCRRTFDITQTPVVNPVCEALNFTTTPTGPLNVGQSATLQVRPIDTNNNNLPANTLLNLTSTAGGQFISNGTAVNSAKINQFPIIFQNSTQTGNVTVQIAETDPAYSGICFGIIPVIPVPQLTCQSLNYNLNEINPNGTQTPTTRLQNNKIYKIKGNALYSQTLNNTITYKIDGNYGHFLTANNPSQLVLDIWFQVTRAYQSSNTLTSALSKQILMNMTATTVTKSANEDVYIVTFSATIPDKADVLQIQATGFNNPQCQAVIPYKFVEIPLVCKALDYNLSEYSTPNTPATRLERNKIYALTSTVQYSSSNTNTVTYNIDGNYGLFFTGLNPNQLVREILFGTIKASQSSNNLTKSLANAILINLTATTVSQSPSVPLYIITLSNTPDSTSSVLKIQATGSNNSECQKSIPFFVGVIQKQCESLTIKPVSATFNPANDTVLNITGNFKDHNGTIEVTTDKGTLSKISPEVYSQKLIFTQAEIAASNNTLSVIYKKTSNFNAQTDTVTVNAIAIGAEAKCKDKLTAFPGNIVPQCLDLKITKPTTPWQKGSSNEQEINIIVNTSPTSYKDQLYYNWDISSGNGNWKNTNSKFVSKKNNFSQDIHNFQNGTVIKVWASLTDNGPKLVCQDSITVSPGGGGGCTSNCNGGGGSGKPSKKEAPTIKKLVYPTNKIAKAKNIININDKTIKNSKYVTYMVIFKPGTDTKSLEIFEETLNKAKINGNQGGFLEYQGMEINILYPNKSKNKTILRTAKYIKDNDTSTQNSDKFFDDDGTKLESYEETYKCDPKTKNICIDSDNFENVVKSFTNKKAIKLKNVETVGKDGAIIIKYQMTNNSSITEKSCKKLNRELGCGEEFKNTVSYKAYTNNSFTGTKKEGSAKAQVIVVCPYVLTRQGGDVFFHDVIDTGIDIAQCSEVKGSTGPGITPTPHQKQPLTRTGGTEDQSPITLDLPSHDICRYSNLETYANGKDTLKGYNNVLKHFSSTICELEADVAEEWQEANINEAISSNITRISRFGKNLSNTKNLQDLNQLTNLKNADTGVFVTDNNLTIGNGNTDFIITKGQVPSHVPAAQTYIVKGADLHIKSNIKYGETNYENNPSAIPSVAFIVIDGNIIIDDEVEQLDGIYMAINLDPKGSKGKITNKKSDGDTATTIEKLLTINGSLIGNVYELFLSRIGVGNPLKDEGSVTIRYDERILLNTPPGISELIDVDQAIVPN